MYDFEYVTYASTQFEYSWHIKIVFNRSRNFLCLGIRNCIILWYHNFLTRWESSHRQNWKMNGISWITICSWNVVNLCFYCHAFVIEKRKCISNDLVYNFWNWNEIWNMNLLWNKWIRKANFIFFMKQKT